MAACGAPSPSAARPRDGRAASARPSRRMAACTDHGNADRLRAPEPRQTGAIERHPRRRCRQACPRRREAASRATGALTGNWTESQLIGAQLVTLIDMAAVIGRAFGGLVPERGPERALTAAVFVSLIGTGSYINTSALFFTRAVHLPVAQVGIGLTISGLVGLAAGIPAGRLADRWGPKRTWIVSLSAEALTMASFVFVHGFWWFVPVACLSAAAAVTSAAAWRPSSASSPAPRPPGSAPSYGRSETWPVAPGWSAPRSLFNWTAGPPISRWCSATRRPSPAAPCSPAGCRPSRRIARPPGRARWIALRDRLSSR